MKRFSLFDFTLIALVLILCIITIFLAKENQALKGILEANKKPTGEQASIIDSVAAAIRVKYIANEYGVISFKNQKVPTILFLFTTRCPHCEYSIPAWKSLGKILDSSECRIVGISMDSLEMTKTYISKNQIDFFVVSVADSIIASKYHIRSVPHTLLISEEGIITSVWSGRFDLPTIAEVVKMVRESRRADL